MKVARLKYFMVTAEELSFSKAARKLGIGQPSLSRAIKELEREVGADLFTRTTNRVTLTEVGELILPKVDEALLLIEETFQDIREFALGRNERLEIGYLSNVLNPFVGEGLEAFRQASPNIALYPHEMTHPEQFSALRAGQIDVGLVGLFSPEELQAEFDLFDLFKIPLSLVVSRDDPLSTREQVRLEDVEDRPLISYSRKVFPSCEAIFERIHRNHGMPYKPFILATSNQSALAAVTAHHAYTLISKVDDSLDSERVAFVPFEESVMDVSYCGMVRRDECRKSVLAFLQECRRVVKMKAPQTLVGALS